MKIIIEGNPEEIAAIVLELQERQNTHPKFVPETANGPCDSTEMFATGASDTDIPTPLRSGTSGISL